MIDKQSLRIGVMAYIGALVIMWALPRWMGLIASIVPLVCGSILIGAVIHEYVCEKTRGERHGKTKKDIGS